MRIKSEGWFCIVYYCALFILRDEMLPKFASVFLEQDLCQYNHDWNKGKHPNWKGKTTNEEKKYLWNLTKVWYKPMMNVSMRQIFQENGV